MFHNFLVIIVSRQTSGVNLGTWRSKDYFSRNEKVFSSMWREAGRRKLISVPLLVNCFSLIPNSNLFPRALSEKPWGRCCPNSPHVRESRFRNPGILSGGIRNPGPCNPKYSSKESWISLTIGIRLIQVPMTKSPESNTWNPAIHGEESRNQDFLGFSYMGRPSWKAFSQAINKIKQGAVQ